ncbi:MAG: polyprenyl diphosphate synthase [Actinomycetota bacterium]|nr:polyprenyl diphosphate synthase [Actinomycetota bacterium]
MPAASAFYRYYERRLARSLPPASLPGHVGVIVDGHRRFARTEGYADFTESYRVGMAKLEELLGWCAELGIQAVTAWVLSTDNLRRPPAELEPYYAILEELFARLPDLARRLGFSIGVSGSLDLLPTSLVQAAKQAERRDPEARLQVNIALCYGGRQEIVDACRWLVADLLEAGVAPADLPMAIDADGIAEHLYAADLPDADLVIRTSGESRLSGFLMWQSAYAECVFVDPYWPAFRKTDLLRALRDYARRERRFGA